MPRPSAMFSPLTTTRSRSSSSRRPGTRRSTASRPGRPTTSATKRMRTRATATDRARDRPRADVVAAVGGVVRHVGLQHGRGVGDRPDPGAAVLDLRADLQRRLTARQRVEHHVRDRDDDGRVARRLDRDGHPVADRVAVDHVGRQRHHLAVDGGIDVGAGARADIDRIRAAVAHVVAHPAPAVAEDVAPQRVEQVRVRLAADGIERERAAAGDRVVRDRADAIEPDRHEELERALSREHLRRRRTGGQQRADRRGIRGDRRRVVTRERETERDRGDRGRKAEAEQPAATHRTAMARAARVGIEPQPPRCAAPASGRPYPRRTSLSRQARWRREERGIVVVSWPIVYRVVGGRKLAGSRCDHQRVAIPAETTG